MKLVLLIFLSNFLYAQSKHPLNDPYTLEGQGSLVNLRFVIGDKEAKLFVVGKEAAKLNFDKDVEILNITAFKKGGVKEELKFEPGKGYYTIEKWPEHQGIYQLSVRTKTSNKEEEVQIEVKARP